MKSRHLIATAFALIGFASFGTTEAETVYRTYVSAQPNVWRVTSPTITVPAPMILERPVTVSESAPIRLSPPMSGTVLHYERPLTESVVIGTSTRISAPVTETVISETVMAPSAPEPLISGGENLKPLPPRRLPPPESESTPKTETVAKPEIKRPKTLETEVAVEKSEKDPLPIRELVTTERLDGTQEQENIFKDIMTSRDLAVPAMVAKPPKPLPSVNPSPVETSPLTEPKPVAAMEIEPLPIPEAIPTSPPASALAERKKPPEPPSQELFLGQSGSRSMVDDILIEPPPYPEGPADPGEIDHKLLDGATIVPGPLGAIDKNLRDKSDKDKPGPLRSRSKAEDQWVGEALLLTTIIASMVACYAVVLAFEFRQRWLQSVTEQNNRFTMSYDGDLFPDDGYYEGTYGDMPLYGNSSDDAGLGRFRPEILEPSMRY